MSIHSIFWIITLNLGFLFVRANDVGWYSWYEKQAPDLLKAWQEQAAAW